jgi:hypothetical protein
MCRQDETLAAFINKNCNSLALFNLYAKLNLEVCIMTLTIKTLALYGFIYVLHMESNRESYGQLKDAACICTVTKLY